MDGVERIMVLGIFAVIVAILGVAAWSVTQDDGTVLAGATDGGASTGTARGLTDRPAGPARSPVVRPSDRPVASGREQQLTAQREQLDAFLGTQREGARAGIGSLSDKDLPLKNGSQGSVARPPNPTGNGPQGGKPASEPGTGGAADRPANGDVAKGAGAPAGVAAGGVATTRQYTVREGDTMWQIAQREVGKEGVTQIVEEIARLNPSIDVTKILQGMTITLPVRGAAPVDGQGERSVASLKAQQPTTTAANAEAGEGFRLYTVKTGDSLSSIAEAELGSSSRYLDLYQANKRHLSSPDKVPVGLTIRIPVGDE